MWIIFCLLRHVNNIRRRRGATVQHPGSSPDFRPVPGKTPPAGGRSSCRIAANAYMQEGCPLFWIYKATLGILHARSGTGFFII
jgi:hypothetical protein